MNDDFNIIFVPESKPLIQEGKRDQGVTFIDHLGEENNLDVLIMRIRLLNGYGESIIICGDSKFSQF